MTCATELTSFEALIVDGEPVKVPVVSSVEHKWIVSFQQQQNEITFKTNYFFTLSHAL